MNQKIQLYIENEQVDVFQDGSINIVSSIKDFRSPDKLFTDFSRNFSLPATARNNKVFKHYYNYDISQAGFDARKTKSARIEINDRPYKDGYITLDSVDLKYNKPSTYKVTFYGNFRLLKELLNNRKLSELNWLDNFDILDTYFDSGGESFYHYLTTSKDKTSTVEKHIGTGDGIKKTFRIDYTPYPKLNTDFKLFKAGVEVSTSDFSYSYTTGDITFNTAPAVGNAITTKLFYKQPIVVPLISTSERLYYNASTSRGYNELRDGNLYYDSTSYTKTNGLKYEYLKPAIRVHLIIRAIEQFINQNTDTNIEFSNDFLNETNKDYYDLYMWLNKDKKDNTQFDQSQKVTNINTFNIQTSSSYSSNYASSNPVLTITSSNQSGATSGVVGDTINVSGVNNQQIDNVELRFKSIPATAAIYSLNVLRNGQLVRSFANLTGTTTNTIEVVQDGNYTFQIVTDTTVSINFTSGFEAKFVIRPNNDETSYNDVVIAGSTLNIAGTPNNFSIPENMPDMTILEFLSGIFKMFNLVCFVEGTENSSYTTTQSNMKRIRVMTFDAYYSSATELDITDKIDISQSSVHRNIPYTSIEFKYEDTEAILAEQHKTANGIEWGGEKWVGVEDSRGEKKYEVIPPFGHMKFERLLDAAGAATKIQVGYSIKRSNTERNASGSLSSYQGEKYNPHYGKPVLFYPHLESSGPAIPYVYTNSSNEDAVFGEDAGGVYPTSYFIPLNSIDVNTSQSNHFGEEIDEYRVYETSEASNVNNLFNLYYKNYITHLFKPESRIINVKANLTNAFLSRYSLSDKIRISDKTYTINKINVNLLNGKSDLELQPFYSITSFSCLNTTFNLKVEVTYAGNVYIFDNKYGTYQMGQGTYVMNDVPSGHPIAFHNFGKEDKLSYTGTNSGGSKSGLDGNTYTYYYGTVTITVNGDFGTMSYECYNHGYMGGENNLIYNADCLTTDSPVTPPVTGTLTVDATDIYADSGIVTADQTDE